MCPRIAGCLPLAALAVFLASPLISKSADNAPPLAPTQSAPHAGIADASQPADVASLLKAVRSDDFHVREQASGALLRLPSDTLSQIEHALADETDAEAISRLTTVALHLYLKDPRITPLQGKVGLLGIALAIEPTTIIDRNDPRLAIDGQIAVVVLDTKPGFPSFEVLKPGDRIVMLEGKPLPLGFSVEAFRQKVSETTPGAFIDLTILRDGKQFRTSVQVAGLERKGDDFISNYVEGRMRLGGAYLSQLRTGKAPAPLVINDNTPPEINIYNEFEFDTP